MTDGLTRLTSVAPFRWMRNWLAIVGLTVFGSALVAFVFLTVIDYLSGRTDPYLGLVAYLVLPSIGTVGLALGAVGAWLGRRRERARGADEAPVGLAVERVEVQQRILVVAGGVAALSVFAMALGGYEAYEYTESVEFCGQLCHQVMKPEYTASRRSPHAQVACVRCHVGPGAASYVQAKVVGLRRVYAMLTDSYERPIPSPLAEMSGAGVTCQQCHWPHRLVGQEYHAYEYYLSEGGPEPWRLELLVDVGGGSPEEGYTSGIHWHMNVAHSVEYMARDEARQDIPWLRVTDADGEVTVYRDVDDPPSEEELAGATIRRMDCMDCHNRPAHRFGAPLRLVNEAMRLGELDPGMPEIKLTALELLAEEYDSTSAALQAIEDGLVAFYAEDYTEWVEDNGPSVERAVATLQRLYSHNMFPEMETRWDSHPDNSGHMFSAGCFRCHAGNLRSDDGGTVTASCDACHTILAQGPAGEMERVAGGAGAFVHPFDEEVFAEPILCHECHDGALGF